MQLRLTLTLALATDPNPDSNPNPNPNPNPDPDPNPNPNQARPQLRLYKLFTWTYGMLASWTTKYRALEDQVHRVCKEVSPSLSLVDD